MKAVLETDRLVLRELTLSDAPHLDAILGDAETMTYYPRPYTPLEVEAWIVKNIERYHVLGYGLWAVVRKEDGAFVGECGLVPQNVEGTHEVEVGWHVNRALWRRGYASEAAAAARDHAFVSLGLQRLVSLVLPANIPSQGVARKIGMVPERIVVHARREHLLFVSGPHGAPDEVTRTRASYELIADEYAALWGARSRVSLVGRERFAARLPAGALVADVGCGPGRDLPLMTQAGLRAVGIDVSHAMARRAAATGAPVAVGDMRRLPVRDMVFGGLWVSASLLHIPMRHARAAVDELRRVLTPGGVLFVGVKLGAGEAWAARHGHPRFYAYYSAESLDGLLGAAGFAVADAWQEEDAFGREPWLNRIAVRR